MEVIILSLLLCGAVWFWFGFTQMEILVAILLLIGFFLDRREREKYKR